MVHLSYFRYNNKQQFPLKIQNNQLKPHFKACIQVKFQKQTLKRVQKYWF